MQGASETMYTDVNEIRYAVFAVYKEWGVPFTTGGISTLSLSPGHHEARPVPNLWGTSFALRCQCGESPSATPGWDLSPSPHTHPYTWKI